MTILVSVKINDGIVLAADSASSFGNGMVYRHADKIVNLCSGLPIGVMVTGAGGIGNESIDTRVRICGYSAGRPLAAVWEVLLDARASPPPLQVQAEHEFGIRWDGEYEALSRLVFGLATGFEQAVAGSGGLPAGQAAQLRAAIGPDLFELLFIEAMPIRDAVDLARFLVDTTVGFIKFSVNRPKLVGGPVSIAAVTKHEGFRWVQRAGALLPQWHVEEPGAADRPARG